LKEDLSASGFRPVAIWGRLPLPATRDIELVTDSSLGLAHGMPLLLLWRPSEGLVLLRAANCETDNRDAAGGGGLLGMCQGGRADRLDAGQRMFRKPVAELTSLDASGLIRPSRQERSTWTPL